MSIQAQSFNPSIQRAGIVRSYARKSEIVRVDDLADHLYEVVSGTVHLFPDRNGPTRLSRRG